jgi:hypothetical protein
VLEAWNGVDYESMLQQILFVFTTHDCLVENKDVREALARVVRLTYSFYRDLKMKVWWTKTDLESLNDGLFCMFKEAADVFCAMPDNGSETLSVEDVLDGLAAPGARGDEAGGDLATGGGGEDDSEEEPDFEARGKLLLKGSGVTVPKMHGLTQARIAVMEFGNVDVSSSVPFERSHKMVKKNALRGNRQRNEASKKRRFDTLALINQREAKVHRVVNTEGARRFNEDLEEDDEAVADSDSDHDDNRVRASTQRRGGAAPQSACWEFAAAFFAKDSDGDELLKMTKALLLQRARLMPTRDLKLARTRDRAAVVLSSGHHVLLKDKQVCLLVTPVVETGGSGASRAVLLPLKPHPSGIGDVRRHPVSGLRWLCRHSLDDLVIFDQSQIDFRVHVVPAFTYANKVIGEDGYLLNHGIYNYDARHRVTPPQPRSTTV